MCEQVSGDLDAAYGPRLRHGRSDRECAAQGSGGLRFWATGACVILKHQGRRSTWTGIIGDSGFDLDWNMPGISKGKTGELLPPAGGSPSGTDILDNAKMLMHACATVDIIAEGGATCESLARTAQRKGPSHRHCLSCE